MNAVDSGNNQATGKNTILVVDDEADIREILKLVLEMEGYHVLLASNGQEAIDLLSKGRLPSLILLDLMMPVMDGWQFLEARKDIPNLLQVPVVVVSAFLDKAQPPQTVEFLKKPFDLEAVSRLVSKYCAADGTAS